jgi:hypothetical protein
VYRNNQRVATALFKFSEQNQAWVWHMNTRPVAPYKWLTRKKPFAETRMLETNSGLQLSQESNGDYEDAPATENTWFDQDKAIIYYTSGEKKRQLNLPDKLYNTQSVHLLVPFMKQQGLNELDINYYVKGKLIKSSLTLESGLKLSRGSSVFVVDKFSQQLEKKDYRMVYYYDGNSLAPLKIEQLKFNGESSEMWRKSVN